MPLYEVKNAKSVPIVGAEDKHGCTVLLSNDGEEEVLKFQVC